MKSRLYKARNRKRDMVLRTLKEAFADVPCPYEDCDREYHDYFLVMREHFWDIGADEMPWELPRILADFITSGDRELIDDMVSHLAIDLEPEYRPRNKYPWMNDKMDEYYRKTSKYLRSSLIQSYQNITRKQAGAIWEWLRYVSWYPEFRPEDADMDTAKRYWRRRAAYRHR